MSLEYVPGERKVAIQILGDVDDDEEDEGVPSSTNEPGMPQENDEALVAICVGVGPKVTVCKSGDTVYVYPWAKTGLCVGDNVRIIDDYCVAARLKK